MAIIGIDIGGTKTAIGVVEDNRILKYSKIATNGSANLDTVLNDLTNLIDSVFDKNISGIGVGFPAPVECGKIHECVNIPAYKEVDLEDILKKRYSVPVFVENDANCFVLGEKYFGKAKGYNNIVGVTLGTGLGVGVIINNKLFSGNSGSTGELGGITYLDKTLEDYCASKFFSEKYNYSAKELAEKIEKGYDLHQETFNSYGWHLGIGLSIIARAYDPEIIVIGGSISKAYNYFEKSMKFSLGKQIYKRTYEKLKIDVSQNENMAILGAAALCLNSH